MVIEALESVIAQSVAPHKIVIVNDNSDDGTEASLKRFIAKSHFTNLVLISNPDHGAASARNYGFSRCHECEFVAFLDSDDIWSDNFLKDCLNVFAQSPKLSIVTHDVVKQNIREGSSRKMPVDKLARSPLIWLVRNEAGLLSCSLLRTAMVQRIGGFPSDIPTGHDVQFFFQISQTGGWGYAPGEPVVKRHDYSDRVGEMNHIYRHYKNPHLRWANAYEAALSELDSQDLSSPEFRRAMRYRWAVVMKYSILNLQPKGTIKAILGIWNWRGGQAAVVDNSSLES